MKYIYRGFMLGIGITISHMIVGSVLLASVWGTLAPIVEQLMKGTQ